MTLLEVNVVFCVFCKASYILLLNLHHFNVRTTFKWISFGWIALSLGFFWYRQKEKLCFERQSNFLHTKVDMFLYFSYELSDNKNSNGIKDTQLLTLVWSYAFIHSILFMEIPNVSASLYPIPSWQENSDIKSKAIKLIWN